MLGLGCGVQGLGFSVEGFRFGVWGLGFGVSGVTHGCDIWGSGFGVDAGPDFRPSVLQASSMLRPVLAMPCFGVDV